MNLFTTLLPLSVVNRFIEALYHTVIVQLCQKKAVVPYDTVQYNLYNLSLNQKSKNITPLYTTCIPGMLLVALLHDSCNAKFAERTTVLAGLPVESA